MKHHMRSMLMLAGWIVLCFSAAALGAMFGPDAWFVALQKPAWQPPNWLFGPVWTTLYLLMAVAIWRVAGSQSPQRRSAIAIFVVQLSLNALWSPLFFGAHQIFAALVVIILLIGLVALCIWRFATIDRLAAGLLLPYLAWISFAAALNFTLWRLNPGV